MSVNLFQTVFPPQNTPVIDKTGTLTNPFMAFFRDLYNRTGAGTGTPYSVGNNLVATGSTQNDALELINDWNNVTTGGGKGVRLPAMTMGQTIVVFNFSGSNVNVYPPSGASLNVLGAVTGTNAPYVSASPDAVIFYFFSDTAILGI